MMHDIQALTQPVHDFASIAAARPHIEAALSYSGGTHTFDDVALAILAGQLHLWPMANGALVTEFQTYPRAKHLNVFLGGGDLSVLVSRHDAIAAWAKAQGCTACTVSGRAGWVKVFARKGWKPFHTMIKKDI